MTSFWISVVVVFFGSWIGGEIFRRACLTYGWYDVPNERSSHTIPTPRGGGTALVVAISLGTLVMSGLQSDLTWIFGPAIAVAVLGFVDDRVGIRASVRFAIQFFFATLALYLTRAPAGLELGFLPALHLSGWVAFVFGLLFVVWMTNLYNFMDGIDGIEALQVLTVSAVSAIFCYVYGDTVDAVGFGIVAAGAAGFLPLNWSPARIFMGDVASGFFGFVLALLAIRSTLQGGLPLVASFIINGTFLADTIFTLVRRTLNGEKPYQAHRLHAYQKLTDRGLSHSKTSLAYGLTNILWLAPIAWAALIGCIDTRVALVIAFLPLFGVCLYTKAGSRSK